MTMNKKLLFSLLSLSIPAIIEMGLNTLLGVVDTIMISQFIGKEALSAVGFANQIVYALIFIFSSFNTGAIALISRSFGERNFDRLKHVANQNNSLNFFIGFVIFFTAKLFNSYIFTIFDIPVEVFNDAVDYFDIILWGFIPMFISFSFGALLRGAGDTKTPMKITAIANLLNVIGNYVLITGFGPFPELGITGAAISTSLSRVIAVILYIYVIYIRNSEIKLKPQFILDKEIIKPLWKISLPGGIEQALMQVSFVVLSVIISSLDIIAEASFRILIQIESLSFMPAIGVSIATATLVGKSLGEKDVHKANHIGFLSVMLGTVWALFIGLIFILFPHQILTIFSSDTSIIEYGAPIMLFLGVNQLGLNYVIIISGALRGAGDTTFVMLNTVLRLWLLFIPLSYLFITVFNYGVVGLWYAEILSFIITGPVLFFRFRGQKWVSAIKI